jgi:beta-galactosidase
MASTSTTPRTRMCIDPGWLFYRGDASGAEKVNFDAGRWRQVELPHDWSIEEPFDPDAASKHDGAFLPGGVGWYRKTFKAPAAWKGKKVSVEFEGVYMDSTVWLNGKKLGNHPYGYTSFAYDLTPHLALGKENVLAVRVNVMQQCSRWYSGAGIYRHVWLDVTNDVHVKQWGMFVTTPVVEKDVAEVEVRTTVVNEGEKAAEVLLDIEVMDAKGKAVGKGEEEGGVSRKGEAEFVHRVVIRKPRLWSPEDPYLYKVITKVKVGEKVVDIYESTVGIRTAEFTMEDGFLLNGKRVEIKGVCMHHDHGCLGAAFNERAMERQIEILQKMGCNAIRTSHNPPAPGLLELCDRMGMLVMDEAFDEWRLNKTPYGYGRFFDEWSQSDISSMVRRDRNHPCIVMWSIGNEVHDQKSPECGATAKKLYDAIKRQDPTRAITVGCNSPDDAVKNGMPDGVDVVGINYFPKFYEKFQGKWKLIASETTSTVSTRGEYFFESKDGKVELIKRQANQCSAYDIDIPGWATIAEDSLKAVAKSKWIPGEFVWTGFDYLGEPTPYEWPSRSSYFGIVDLAGFPKDRFYLYQSRWTDEPMVHLFPHWNWAGKKDEPARVVPVRVYSNCKSVELFLNGRSLGEKSFADTTDLHLDWEVAWEAGELKAVAKNGGKKICEDVVRTAGPAAKMVLEPDRKTIDADGMDLSYVTVKIVDKDGNVVPDAANMVRFEVEGAGRLEGVDNGNPTCLLSFKGSYMKAFHGLCLAVVRSQRQAGDITLKAASDWLPDAKVVIKSR